MRITNHFLTLLRDNLVSHGPLDVERAAAEAGLEAEEGWEIFNRLYESSKGK